MTDLADRLEEASRGWEAAYLNIASALFAEAAREYRAALRRVEALEALFKAAFKFPSVLLQEETRNFIVALGEKYDALPPVPSTPAADLAAHDDRIRRETVERTVEEVMDVDCVRDLDGFEQLNIQEAIHRAAGIPAPSTGEEE